jgi:signal transduction histidine kinase
MNRHRLIEIIASDVSEEQLLHERLKAEQERADRLNERLKTLNSTIEVMTAEKEILETKSMVHDEWGKTLLMSRRYLSVPDEELGHEILKQWKLNAMLLKDEEDLDINDDYSVVLKDIRTMGLETRIKGDLPQEDELKHLLVLTLRTCATNALRHGKGNRLNVLVEDNGSHFDIKVSNNGIVPDRPIEAGGGLTNLKKAIERIGGELSTEYGEEFAVCVRLPKEGE